MILYIFSVLPDYMLLLDKLILANLSLIVPKEICLGLKYIHNISKTSRCILKIIQVMLKSSNILQSFSAFTSIYKKSFNFLFLTLTAAANCCLTSATDKEANDNLNRFLLYLDEL